LGIRNSAVFADFASLGWAGDNKFRISVNNARPLVWNVNAAGDAWQINNAANPAFIAVTDGVGDIGAPGANRPNNAYIKGEIRSATFGSVYNAAGTQQTAAHVVADTCTLGTNCAVTFSGSAVFTSASSYSCSCTDQTATNACRGNQSSGTAVTFTGTGTDVLRYVCTGN
jgi:hypothetical protein